MAAKETRKKKLDLWLTLSAKRTLQRAVEAPNRSVSELVLESALARADETLPDRRRFSLSAKSWNEFQLSLDAPVGPAPRIAKLMEEQGAFGRG